ncbi:MAG: undecaprenyl/decaprenyl-phosphate alpha-N-acetylglucosaminyl 1-phosphate transferase [Candidatus Doudnabacteria bacterium]|nr:undecaprenyl/decaprenyl-phosphate alpha-N-acetylglucosaminyl 1-phosphate transferase [Candidatus Doudnabacteria bacterium]
MPAKFIYFISFALALLISFVGTFLVARIAVRRKIMDYPDGRRKFHEQPTPTLGGMAIFGSFFLVTLTIGLLAGYLSSGNIPLRNMIGIWAGGLILMIGGYLDDKYQLPPQYSILFPILATLSIISSGIQAVSVHNPLTGNIVSVSSLLSVVIVFIWVMTMTYTTKFLDGMDGLVTGISGIAALVIFALSLTSQVRQPHTALLAITFAGSLFGFLILNFHPAKIFLGEAGSTFTGFMLAVLAVISGGKIATAVLVMGIPLLDMVWVILQRLFSKQSPFKGDRKHLHFKLLDLGFSQPQAVLFLYALTGIFGATALLLQSLGKLVALGVLVLFTIALLILIFVLSKVRQKLNE